MIIGVILVVLILFGLFAWIVFAGVFKLEHDQNKAEKNAEQILNVAFDGKPDVTFPLNMRTLKPATVLTGAKQRGYELVHQSENMYGPTAMIFEKATN